MIRVAVIGAGAISPRHIESYLRFPERCAITAVVDIYPEKAAASVERFGLDAVVAEDYREVLGEADLVSICTPPSTHTAIAIGSLEAGVNVLVEKPMAASLAECDAMLAAEAASGKLLSVVAQNRFRTPMMRLKQVLDAGLAGKVLHAQVESYWWRGNSYYDLWWRGTWESEGGGCTLNHAVHHLDALAWMMGVPTQVQAMMANLAHDKAEVEDCSIATMRFAGGSLGQATSSVVHHGEEQQLVFQAERARVSFPWRTYASKERPNGFPERDEAAEAELDAYFEALPELAHELHAGQIDNVLGALEAGTAPMIDGREGRNALELITAIYKSAVTGERVDLPIAADDPYYTSEGLEKTAPRYHEKAVSVTGFSSNEITTGPPAARDERGAR